MKTIVHHSNSRGHANHGWLNAHHTFSFANYYDPERVHFGALRVLNDDIIAGGMGFGTHPHDNMEIISIPIEGVLAHKDSMGNGTNINAGDIQVMSAGSGISHSEFNPEKNLATNLLQIWLFPNKKNVEPRYQQQTIDQEGLKNNFLQILSPNADDQGVWIHQNAWFHMGKIDAGKEMEYTLKDPNNGVYVFMIEGSATLENQALGKRDGMGLWETDKIKFNFTEKSHVLILELPMLF